MSVYKTELLDPFSSTKIRSIYALPENVKVNSRKVRLLNFRVKKTDKTSGAESPHLFGLGGAIECISKISVQSRNGVEIDRISGEALRYLGMKLALSPNCTQYAAAKTLAQHMDLSVITPNFSSVKNGNPYDASNDYWDVNNHSLTISVSSMLQYLGVARSVINEGLTIIVEWALEKMGATGNFTYDFDAQPQIAYDIYLDDTPVDKPKNGTYIYYSMVQDTMPLKVGVENTIDKRFTAYVKQYIGNMYYMVKDTQARASGDVSFMNDRTAQLTEPGKDEVLQLSLEGSTLYSRKGISTSAMKQQFFNDYFNESNIPAGAYNLLNHPLGLTSDQRISFGVCPINRYVATELQLQYTNKKFHTTATQFITIAEILRSYTPNADVVAFVVPPS
jgi:hypothetical protein